MADNRVRVLYVDDDQEFGEVAKSLLERERDAFEVSTETDPREVEQLLEGHEFDCIVADYEMPGLIGIELLEQIRERDQLLPVILFTDEGSEAVASDAISAGVTDYLQKDGGADQFTVLADRIASAVEHRLEQYRTVVETAGDGMYVLDEDGFIEIVNDAFVRMSGYDRDELIGNHVSEFLAPEQIRQGTEAIKSLLRSDDRDVDVFTFRAQRPDGESRLYETTVSLVERNGFAGSVGIVRDITDDRRGEELLTGLFEESLHGIGVKEIVTDESGEPVDYVYKRVNDRFEELTGLDADTVVGNRATEAIDGIEETPFIEIFGEVALEDTTAQFEQYSAPLNRYYEVSAFSPRSGECISIFSDITERKEREQELRQFEIILETLEDGVYAVDESGRITYANEQYVQLKGADREELYGTKVDRWVTPDGVEQIREQAAELEHGEREVAHVEYRSKRADGSEFPAELRFTDIEFQDGSRGRVGVVRDITERKERERDLERKNEQLDEFASVVAHDLRNPLTVAQGRLELARETGEREHFEKMEKAHDRMFKLIEDLLGLARSGLDIGDTQEIALSDVVHEGWQMVGLGEATLSIHDDLTMGVEADQKRLRELFENLFRNAIEHGGSGVEIEVGELPDERGFYVEDTGPGIPEESRKKVLEAGYSTAEEGTGFGLAIVKEIVEAHGWTIRVTDGSEGGARFEITGVRVVE